MERAPFPLLNLVQAAVTGFVRPQQFSVRRLVCALAIVASSACSPVYFVGMRVVYRGADLPARQIIRDVSYLPLSADPKHRLDLFMPEGRQWPTVVFVHGGSWREGDRGLRVGGSDIYGNIGRFLAGHGIGAAIISYRLVPAVDWRAQADDLLQAVRWVSETSLVYGGRRDAIFLAGHSAGAQLAARVALDSTSLTRAGVPPRSIRGMFLVSGAGYDLEDQATYDLGHSRAFYGTVFGASSDATGWARTASPIQYVGSTAPPSVVMCAGGDEESVKRQSQVLFAALTRAGARTRLAEVPGTSHTRIVPMLSRVDREAGSALLAFVREEMARAD